MGLVVSQAKNIFHGPMKVWVIVLFGTSLGRTPKWLAALEPDASQYMFSHIGRCQHMFTLDHLDTWSRRVIQSFD